VDDQMDDGSGDGSDGASSTSNPIHDTIIYRSYILSFHPLFWIGWNRYPLDTDEIVTPITDEGVWRTWCYSESQQKFLKIGSVCILSPAPAIVFSWFHLWMIWFWSRWFFIFYFYFRPQICVLCVWWLI